MESLFVGGGSTELGDRYGARYRTIIENSETIRDKRLAGEQVREKATVKEKEGKGDRDGDGLGRSTKRESRP